MVAGGQVLFEYRHVEGDQWHLTSEVIEEVLIDGELYWEAEILNRISVEVREGEGDDGILWNRYVIAESRPDSDVYGWSAEYETEYGRDTRGRLSGLDENDPIPTVRGVPSFPDYEVSPGDRWEAPGTEVSDLDPVFGIPVVMTIDFDARYRYEGIREDGGSRMDVVTIEYGFTWQPDSLDLAVMKQCAYYPQEIIGRFRQEVLWDRAAGRNYAEEGVFSHTYYMSDGHVYTFRGSSRGRAIYVEDLDRDALVDEIEDLGEDDLRAEAVDDGVKVSIEDINFVPDEARLLPGQETKLDGIIEVLRRHPNRDIQILGHTARISGGSDGQLLSEQRAETVAELLINSGVRSRDRITIRGMGNRDPIGDNSTEAGRRLNRRVEIIILEN